MLSNGEHMKGATECWVVERVFVPVDRATQEANLHRLHALLLRGAQRLAQAELRASKPAEHVKTGGKTDA